MCGESHSIGDFATFIIHCHHEYDGKNGHWMINCRNMLEKDSVDMNTYVCSHHTDVKQWDILGVISREGMIRLNVNELTKWDQFNSDMYRNALPKYMWTNKNWMRKHVRAR